MTTKEQARKHSLHPAPSEKDGSGCRLFFEAGHYFTNSVPDDAIMPLIASHKGKTGGVSVFVHYRNDRKTPLD